MEILIIKSTDVQNIHNSINSTLDDLLCADFIDSTEDRSSGLMCRLLIKFRNGMQLSVICGEYSYGGGDGLFEIAPFNEAGFMDGNLLDEEDQGDDVCGNCDVEKVQHYIKKLGTIRSSS